MRTLFASAIRFLPALCLAAGAVGSPLDLGTFSVTGSGSFTCDERDAIYEYSGSFNGLNASYSIQFGTSGVGGSNPFPYLQFPGCASYVGQNGVLSDTYPPSYNIIEPFQASVEPSGSTSLIESGPATFELGNGAGYLDIYSGSSPTAVLVATANLVGYVTVNAVNTSEPFYPEWDGTFLVTPDPVPEPSTRWLVGLVLGLISIARRGYVGKLFYGDRLSMCGKG